MRQGGRGAVFIAGVVAALVVALVLALVGVAFLFVVGGGDSAERRAAGEQHVVVNDVAPMPEVRLAAGEKALFRNEDDVAHTFTADGGLFDSGRVEPGGTFEFSFPAPGEVSYHCEIHPSMTGRVVVSPA